MPCSLRNRRRCSRGIRRSCEPGILYPRKRPESNHLLTVRGATLQIFATWPVVKTFFMAGTPVLDVCLLYPPVRRGTRRGTIPQTWSALGSRAEREGPLGASCQGTA